MVMGLANAICLVAFVVPAAFSTTQQAQAEAPAAAPSPAAVEFLRGRCTYMTPPKRVADYCYDSLLPQAGTFNGSTIRVIGAATELMAANFRTFLADLRKLDGTKYKVDKCVEQAAGFDKQPEPEMLAKVRALAAMGDDSKVEYSSVIDVRGWLEAVDVSFDEECQKEMKGIPDADKLLPNNKNMYSSILVAQDLVSTYTPPGAYP